MRFITVVSGKNGGASIKPFLQGCPDYTGHQFLIGEYKINILKGNLLKIPKYVMEKYGYLRKDGRYAFAMDTGWTTVDKKRHPAGVIVESDDIRKFLDTTENGNYLTDAELYHDENDEYLHPEHVKDIYGDL